jgi:CubicO group peptidase (beta-lactamase class C family)
VLIARHGIVVLNEAFGPCDLNQKFPVASITRTVAGLMFARFVDQGLIGVDQPVGCFLPDFPTDGVAGFARAV